MGNGRLRSLVTLLLLLSARFDLHAATRWAVYYSDRAPSDEFDKFSLLILDSDHHPPLEPLARRKTLLGYVSVGEAENNRAHFAAVRGEGILLQENPNWKGSYFVDLRDPRWSKRVLDQLIPQILRSGFAGVFLDTLDNAAHLERVDPQKYRGMTQAAADLVKAIRLRFPSIKIMMNRGYEILPQVERDIDYVLGESVYADYDFAGKTYRLVPQNQYREQVNILKSAQQRRPELQVFTLDYWYPKDIQGIARIYQEERRNGFSPYVATIELDQIIDEPLPAGAVRAPRTILALYDSLYEKELRYLPTHQIAEMPLNHLGLVVRYHDINRPFPKIADMQDIRGVLTWFRSDSMADPLGFLKWAESVMDAGKKFVVVGDVSAGFDSKRNPTPPGALKRFWSRLGLKSGDSWITITYDWAISSREPAMVEFERSLSGVLPAFPAIQRIDSRVKSYLAIRRSGDPATEIDLVTVSPAGAYVAAGYVHFAAAEDSPRRQWYLNPFEFFRTAYATDDLPKPDTNTLSGRRIFYSHVDGDGWRNVTEVSPYKKQKALAAEVILNEIIAPFSDLPVTVAPIAADLDPDWYGTNESIRIARAILASPNVEAGSHTYGHPLNWEYFAQPAGKASELGSESIFQRLMRWLRPPPDAMEFQNKGLDSTPRTYNVRPFSVQLEVQDSIRFINGLLPPGKTVQILQWSGDTTPSEAAVAATRAAGVRNLNGGDTRFDPEFHSYGWVAPLTRHVGGHLQVYASNSNENTYTDLWTDRFFGFKYLIDTLKNTETPIRVKPHNIYYHMYSGEKLPSLLAVQENYSYAGTQELAPVTASTYASIVDGFYSVQIHALGDDRWQIQNRGALQTIRFDRVEGMSVDFSRSSGTLGQRMYQNSLYVALDAEEFAPVIALSRNPSSAPYLSHSRWRISGFRTNGGGFMFVAHGFGPGETIWHVLPGKTFLFEVMMEDGTVWQNRRTSDAAGLLRLNLGPPTSDPVQVRVTPAGAP